MEKKLSQEGFPEFVQRRIKLAHLFYPLDRKMNRQWGSVLKSGPDSWTEKLKESAGIHNMEMRALDQNTVLWEDGSTEFPECMFVFVEDPAIFERVEEVVGRIRKLNPFFTYLFIHQVKDGPHIWDVFRMSKFSYFEHCNRIYSPK